MAGRRARVLGKPGSPFPRNPRLVTMSVIRVLSAAFLAAALLGSSAWAETARVTFVLVNDVYQAADQMTPDGRRRGGFARLAAIVKAERAKANAAGGRVILAHGGDTLSPSVLSGIDHGAHIVTLTNLVAPDIFVPGNHEFDFGKEIFLQRMAEASFPVYAANLRGPDGRQLRNFQDRSIVIVGGVRIGLSGAAYDKSAMVSDPKDLKFSPTIATLTEQAAALRREGADFVVAVAHATREQGYALLHDHAADLVLTGHTHDLLVNYDGIGALVESSYDARYVTAIDVTIGVKEADGRRVTTWWPEFRVIDSATVTPDPEVAALVARLEQGLDRELDVPIATTAVELDSRVATVRTQETAIGNLIADAMRSSGNADAAMTNAGGIRGGRIYAPGASITRRDILGELPFGNRVVTIETSGGDLRRALENGLSRLPNGSGRFPQVSGLSLQADVSRPAGHRVTSVRIGDAPLDERKTYRLAVNDFMARGGDDYEVFAAAKPLLPIADSPLLTEEVIEHIRQLGTVRSTVEGRIVLK
jgi:2',3'-cyclic-nucleotide 2'-phosphodiesterase (5'-nucleotidase family)